MENFYDRLRHLLDWKAGPEARVLSLYLDVARGHEERSIGAAEAAWEELRGGLDEGGQDAAFCDLVGEILAGLPAEVEAAQAADYDGLAVFASARPPLRESFRLRFSFENQLVVEHEPQTWQLAYYEEEYEQSVVVTLGPKVEVSEVHVGDVVARHPVRPSHGRSLDEETLAQLHLLLHDHPRVHILLLGPAGARARLLGGFDDDLRGRVTGEADEALSPGDEGFLRVVHRLQQAYERQSEAAGVQSLCERRARGEVVAAGLTEVLQAVNRGRVRKLFVLQSFSGSGWVCDACDYLGAGPRPPACTACGASVSAAPLGQHLIKQSRACGAEIETVFQSPALVALDGVAAEVH